MNKKAKEEIEKKLTALQGELRCKIQLNKWNMKKLVDEQTSMKRQLVEYTKLIRSLK